MRISLKGGIFVWGDDVFESVILLGYASTNSFGTGDWGTGDFDDGEDAVV